ncbi:hypothetical protein E4T56_gene8985 [Termitomyces sp. T112]|nr:hypothetical protein E4T56_gene8985 [Termitomyces sp. T112]KAH0583399.1 hypothetical protein H2248_009026 [Termitomyces sp. 'cryptogamus']
MSQVKLILRPPPNVDFVHGYPGIPPGGPDRPQAAVKGTVEVRAGPQGAKTKWVRIELRKVETLPGGGGSNTFYDSVGSPINLWQSSDEFGVLRTHDFPFSIRIPESIPPSIALDNRAGIQYELVASLCTRGKRSFFRKRKPDVVSTQTTVMIDKHELHSTWPIYCQPETRQTIQNGATLIVDRNQLCYGPGDRISLMALLKSDTLSDTILRGFELTLKEYSRFQPGQQAGRKAAPPQDRVVTICDSKLAINGTLFPGHEHRAELNCLISQNHTTTSLSSARHIDVTYILSVKAIVDNVSPIVMDLPVMISNWQRGVSQEAIRRIGPTPGLSLGPVRPISQTVTRAETARLPPTASTLPISKDNYGPSPPTNTSLPAKMGAGAGLYGLKVDEFGFSTTTTNTKTAHSRTESVASSDDHSGGRPAVPLSNSNATATRRSGPANTPGAGRRLTVTNPLIETTQPETDTHLRPPPTTNTNTVSPAVTHDWMTAGEEKQRLYDKAKAKVEMTQKSVPSLRTNTPPPQRTASPQILSTQPAQPTLSKKWPTAEEEKTRLYNEAQAAVIKKQGIDSSPPASIHDYEGRGADSIQQSPNKPSSKKLQELYSEAIAARNQAMARQQSATTSPAKSPLKTNMPQYPTAEQEKAALKRYREAKEAVDRSHNGGKNGGFVAAEDAGSLQSTSGPVSYESLYPETKGASTSTPTPANGLPPPFETPANLIPASHLSEKERLRRQYEEQDAAALARQKAQLVAANTAPPPFSQETQLLPINGVSSSSINSAISEKEAIRRKFEARDAQAQAMNAAPGYTPQPPPRSNSASIPTTRSSSRGPRSPPAVPFSPGRVLTAAEEKALLKAQFAAHDARAKQDQQQPPPLEYDGGPSRPSSAAFLSPITSPLPPPLMPRPPVEYIQETQEEDARVSKVAMNNDLSLDDGLEHPIPLKPQNGSVPRMHMRPFSPFSAGFDQAITPPPPLPPKPTGE